jgi:subtilisin family serine protease
MRTASCVLGTLMCCATLAAAAPHLPGAPREAFEPGEVLVALAPGASLATLPDGRARAANVALAETMSRLGLARADVLSAANGAGAGEIVRLRSSLPDFDPVAAATALRAQPGVVGAAPNLHLRLDLAPNDPYLPNQWHLSNSAAGVHAQQGWARQTGGPGAIIAIIDTGVDLTHSDLYANIWTNAGEIAGNYIDDDHDGFMDDTHGWDFGDADNDPNPDPIYDPYYGIDEGWHGTFVAGLAAGVGNNGVGISGMVWNGRIMPLKISDMNGDLLLGNAISAMAFARAHHASVINLSFGITDASARTLLQPAINAAVNAGVVCVASAGNSGTDTPQYPAACDSVLAVASTNASNVRSEWSNWGWFVDLAAPGEAMWSCIARNYQYDDYSLLAFQEWWGFDGLHAYMENDGTSFATPLVAGAVALVREEFPWLTPKQVLVQMVLDGEFKAYDNPIGPKLDLDRALTYALSVDLAPAAAAGGAAFAPPAPNPARSRSTLRFALARPGRARLAVYDAAGRQVRVLLDGECAAGERSVAWDLADAAGRPVNAGLYFAKLEAADAGLTRRVAVVR